MKNLALTLMLATLTTGAFAHVFEDKVEQTELATTLLNCSSETQGMLKGHDFVNEVVGKYAKLSKRVTTKTYAVKTVRPIGFGATMPGPTLKVVLTVTQPPEGSADMPSMLQYNCSVIQN